MLGKEEGLLCLLKEGVAGGNDPPDLSDDGGSVGTRLEPGPEEVLDADPDLLPWVPGPGRGLLPGFVGPGPEVPDAEAGGAGDVDRAGDAGGPEAGVPGSERGLNLLGEDTEGPLVP